MVTLIALLTFCAAFLLVWGINMWYVDARLQRSPEQPPSRPGEGITSNYQSHRAVSIDNELQKIWKEDAARSASRQPIVQRMKLYLQRSGLRWEPGKILSFALMGALIAGAAAWLLSANPWIAGSAALAGASLPFVWIAVKHRKRMEQLRSQLPDAFDMIARSIRAGQTFAAGMQSTVDELSPPLSHEFGYCNDRQLLGVPPDKALYELANRTGILEVRIFSLAVSIHRQTGGNLASLLEKLADVIRERYRTKDMINALTAEGRFQAYVLMALPVFLLVLMTFLNREYAAQLFHRPKLLIGIVCSMAIGGLWMRKIVNLDI